jgi:hypothetical protein
MGVRGIQMRVGLIVAVVVNFKIVHLQASKQENSDDIRMITQALKWLKHDYTNHKGKASQQELNNLQEKAESIKLLLEDEQKVINEYLA